MTSNLLYIIYDKVSVRVFNLEGKSGENRLWKKVQIKKTDLHLLSRTTVRAHALVFASNGCASRALTFDNVSSQRRFSIVCAQDSYIYLRTRPEKEREKRGKAMQLTYVERDYTIFFYILFFFFFSSERIENDAKIAGANDMLRGRRKFGRMWLRFRLFFPESTLAHQNILKNKQL